MLHDANAGAGAMAHILLPSKSLARDVTNLAKFPETAVPLLVEQLTALGAEPRRLIAKLAGGASMFAQLMTPGSVQMGERNVAAARDVLRRTGIPVMREAVGGGAGRSVRFYVADGRVEIRSRSEEHTSELQSRLHLVCRLLLEKKKNLPGNDHRARRMPTIQDTRKALVAEL